MAIPSVRRPLLIAALAAGLILALVIGGRAAWRLGHRFDRPPPVPRQTDVTQIAGWMSARYVARAYRVPPRVLFEALGVSPEDHGARSFDAIAAQTGRSSEDVLAIVQTTVATWQEEHPPPERGAPKPDRRVP
jgi:hypothetical protein